MTPFRYLVYVEQTVNGKSYRKSGVSYRVDNPIFLMNLCNRMDIALYRDSGAILPTRTWWTEVLD